MDQVPCANSFRHAPFPNALSVRKRSISEKAFYLEVPWGVPLLFLEAKRNVSGNRRHVPPKTPFLNLLFRTPENRDRRYYSCDTRFCAIPCTGQLESLLFLKLFGHPRDIPDKNPAKKVWFPWVSRDTPSFLAPAPSRGRPPPLHVEDPHPTGRYPDPKSLGLCSFFLGGS